MVNKILPETSVSNSTAHPSPYSMGSRGSFPRDKASEVWSEPLTINLVSPFLCVILRPLIRTSHWRCILSFSDNSSLLKSGKFRSAYIVDYIYSMLATVSHSVFCPCVGRSKELYNFFVQLYMGGYSQSLSQISFAHTISILSLQVWIVDKNFLVANAPFCTSSIISLEGLRTCFPTRTPVPALWTVHFHTLYGTF